MLDPRILARLVDPAALASAGSTPGLAPDEVAAALRPFLDATVSDPLSAPAAPDTSPDGAADASPFLLPVAPPVQDVQGRGAAPPFARDEGTDPASLLDSFGPGGAWEQEASLIEPASLLSAPENPRSEPARGSSGATPPGRPESAWSSPGMLSSPGRPQPDAAAPAASPDDGDWGRSAGDLSGLAPRLIQAAERLEAAAAQLSRLAGRSDASSPRAFRGRAAD